MKKYQIIYADPPWRYGGRSKMFNDPKRQNIEEIYNTLHDNELKLLPINKITDDNCILFLWVTSPHLKECIEVGESWGFKYVTVGFVWHKRCARLGNYTMSGCELCIILKKGRIPQHKLKGKGVKQFYEERVIRHSQKPDEFRKRIEQLFPKSNRIELFARQKTEGWDVWGNEVESDIDLSITNSVNK